MNDRKKLVLTCTHSLGAKFLEGQALFMRKNGYDVFIISAPGQEIETLCNREGAVLIPVNFRREMSLLADLGCTLQLIYILKGLKADLINTGTPKAGLLVCLAAKLIGHKRVIFTLRGLRSETLLGLKKKVVRLMERFTCSLATCVMPISPSLREHAIAERILKQKKSVVLGKGSSNGVSIDKFTKGDLNIRETERNRLGIPSDSFVISYVGRFNNDKGIPELFSSFKRLLHEFPLAKLLLVGRFEEEDAIPLNLEREIRANPNVVIENYREDIKTIYEVIDLLVLFSKREGFGNILIEASAMEVPVIANNIPGCRDAVNNGVSGYLVSSEEELFIRMKEYISSPSLVEEHGLQGRKWVVENFSSHIIWENQLKLYSKILEND